MSQQTQISRVLARFDPFIARFPSPEDLARASIADTLSAWSGLGYNRRGLRLREAAIEIAESGWPKNSSDLERLPGVGPYTAAAVACFAFGEQVPAIDTNLRRVLTRWRGTMMSTNEVLSYAAHQLASGHAADWNQAVMDLGATLCRPRQPDCAACPVESWCSDPSAYRRPVPQARFQGSRRQVRGAVIRALLDGSATTAVLEQRIQLPGEDVAGVAQILADEGMVAGSAESEWFLPA